MTSSAPLSEPPDALVSLLFPMAWNGKTNWYGPYSTRNSPLDTRLAAFTHAAAGTATTAPVSVDGTWNDTRGRPPVAPLRIASNAPVNLLSCTVYFWAGLPEMVRPDATVTALALSLSPSPSSSA